MDRLFINVSIDEPTILKLSLAYRTVIARNISGLLKGRLVRYEPIPTAAKIVIFIVVLISLRPITFNLIHITPVTRHMREYKTLYRIKLQFLGLDYVLMFLTG